jgi:hypothetical protein
MAVNITSNKKGTSATIHISNANAMLTMAGNSSVSVIALGDEVLTGAYITQLYFGHDGSAADGGIVVYRNSNVVFASDTSTYLDFAGTGMALNVNQTANLDVRFIGTNNAYCFLEVQKVGNLTANSQYFQN